MLFLIGNQGPRKILACASYRYLRAFCSRSGRSARRPIKRSLPLSPPPPPGFSGFPKLNWILIQHYTNGNISTPFTRSAGISACSASHWQGGRQTHRHVRYTHSITTVLSLIPSLVCFYTSFLWNIGHLLYIILTIKTRAQFKRTTSKYTRCPSDSNSKLETLRPAIG